MSVRLIKKDLRLFFESFYEHGNKDVIPNNPYKIKEFIESIIDREIELGKCYHVATIPYSQFTEDEFERIKRAFEYYLVFEAERS